MLERLHIENFTVFSKANFEFAAGLNVIVGENGTGKSHVLKLVYAVIAESNKRIGYDNSPLLWHQFSEKLINTFRAEKIDHLKRRKNNNSNKISGMPPSLRRLVASFSFNISDFNLKLYFSQTNLLGELPAKWITEKAVFIPVRELLTIYPGFASLYEARYLQFEETYYDTCLFLGEPLLKKPMTDLLSALEEAMGGKVELDRDRFYLVTPEQGKMEMPMVAEGIRKLAMLTQLVAVGALQKGGYLCWAEPEANLNPRLVKVVARVILQLAKAGIQIFIATHSYFLLKELDILTMEQPIPTRYFSLLKGEDGVVVESGDSLDDLQTIVALDEELAQFDREQDAHHA